MDQRIIEEIPLDLIDFHPQVRSKSDPEVDAGLAQSIAAVGVLVPVILRRHGARYGMVDGHRRHASSRAAGCKTLPAIVVEQEMTQASIVQCQLITACQREDLRPGDRARGIQAVTAATGWGLNQVAEQLGLSVASISRSLALLRYPDLLRRVDAGELPASAAYELGHIADPVQQAEFARRLASGQLTRDGLSRAIKGRKQNASGESSKRVTRVVAVMEGNRSVVVSAAGLTLDSFLTCLEELLAKGRRARQQQFSLGTFVKALKDQHAKA